MDQKLTRRRVITVAGGALTLPAFVDVARADTDSGHVELETVATIPTDTDIEITTHEDTDDSGESTQEESQDIEDGTNTYELQSLETITDADAKMWMVIDLSTEDDEETPELDSATLTVPETFNTPEPTPGEEPAADEPQGLFEISENFYAFASAVVGAYLLVGLWSKSLAIAAWGAYLSFLYISFETEKVLLENIALATLVLVFLGMAFKLVRLEFEGES